MRRCTLLILVLSLLICLGSQAAAEETLQSDLLEAALSHLEQGNPLLEHYNQVTGRSVQARFELGCPYFWGGRAESRLGTVMNAWQSSPGYYIKGYPYIYGYDCNGFIGWLLRSHGFQPLGSISGALYSPSSPATDIEGSRTARGKELSARLQIGDVLAIRHHGSSYHIAMYIGTLRQYGYTEEGTTASIRALLDYPLIIHCTVSSDYYIRYESYIEDAFDTIVYPPDGGVIVSVVAPVSMATDEEINPDNGMTPYCLLDGYRLQIYDLSRDTETRWIRWPKST